MKFDKRLRSQLTELNEIIIENTQENINIYEIGHCEDEDNINNNAEKKGWPLIDARYIDDHDTDRLTTSPFSAELFMSMISFIQYNHLLQDFFTEYGHYFNIDKEDLRNILASYNHFKLSKYNYELCQENELLFLRSLLIFSSGLESFLDTKYQESGVNVSIDPIKWTGTKEQLASVTNTLVDQGLIPGDRKWQVISEHFVIYNSSTQSSKNVESKELGIISSKTPPSRESVKKVTTALTNNLQSPQLKPSV